MEIHAYYTYGTLLVLSIHGALRSAELNVYCQIVPVDILIIIVIASVGLERVAIEPKFDLGYLVSAEQSGDIVYLVYQ